MVSHVQDIVIKVNEIANSNRPSNNLYQAISPKVFEMNYVPTVEIDDEENAELEKAVGSDLLYIDPDRSYGTGDMVMVTMRQKSDGVEKTHINNFYIAQLKCNSNKYIELSVDGGNTTLTINKNTIDGIFKVVGGVSL